MKAVPQEDPYGCGVACVAFVSRKNYAEVVLIMGKKQAQEVGFYCKEIIATLHTLGLKYNYNYLKPRFKKNIYQNDVIVYTKKNKVYPAGHYLVRYDGTWMDPWTGSFRKRLPGKPIYGLFPDKKKKNANNQTV